MSEIIREQLNNKAVKYRIITHYSDSENLFDNLEKETQNVQDETLDRVYQFKKGGKENCRLLKKARI
jgi:hypothetical protein